ncbi:MAG: response regulator transcription factor [Anaerolineaceae bacterium]|nr:response regulator transcription factor [Anaerolineaceae bacterium]
MTELILVVDDEQHYRDLIRINLATEGYEVINASNGEEALEILTNKQPDLVILDVLMPIMDGLTTCKKIRQFSNVPLIFLTALANEIDRVKGLNLGADDYLAKPFSAQELIARVRAILRRSSSGSQIIPNRYFSHGDLKIDFARAEVWKNNNPINLTSTEYKLLIQFANNVGHVLTGEKLLASVWGNNYRDEKEILWVSIARLRQKLEDNTQKPKHILTRTGIGYIMPKIDQEK